MSEKNISENIAIDESNDNTEKKNSENINTNSDNKHNKHKNKKKMSGKRKVLIIVLIFIFLILLVIGVVFGIINSYLNKLNIVSEDSKAEILSSIPPDDDLTDDPDSPQEEIDELTRRIDKNILDDSGLMYSDDVYNVLFIGTDSRSKNDRGRSDSMILVSINKKTKEIVMTSFLRDIYLSIPNIEYTRMNHSYAYGGADLVLETLKQNFKIRVDKYVQINFASFIDAVDLVGGIDVTINADELKVMDYYLPQELKDKGESAKDYKITTPGKHHLNGVQALAYSRIRYVGTDFGRTDRQRFVLEQIFNKARNLKLSKLSDLCENIFPMITTNVQKNEIFEHLLNAYKYAKYDFKQCRIPVDNTWKYLTIRGMSVLGIDFEENIYYLAKQIYHNS